MFKTNYAFNFGFLADIVHDQTIAVPLVYLAQQWDHLSNRYKPGSYGAQEGEKIREAENFYFFFQMQGPGVFKAITAHRDKPYITN